jgi:serine protease
LYPTTGRGAWTQPSTIGWNWQSLNALIGAGDFDGTGGVDILARNAGGDLVLYQGDGSGRWLGSRTVGWRWDGFAQLR